MEKEAFYSLFPTLTTLRPENSELYAGYMHELVLGVSFTNETTKLERLRALL